jgi:beta-lactamase superfamily II metal-dependent hydrolase
MIAAALFAAPTPLLADDLLVQRNVTVRESPVRGSEPVDYVAPGDRLDLLEPDERRNGYYRVRLPDGREGWVYYTFVRRVADEDDAVAAPGAPAPGTYRIHSIDVGTGLAIFVEGADFTLLYDAGSNDDAGRDAANRVAAYLKAVRPSLTRIDHLVLSHPHKDHVEMMDDVFEQYDVDHVWDSGSLQDTCGYRVFLETVIAEPGVAYHNATTSGGVHEVPFPAGACRGQRFPQATVKVPRSTAIGDAPITLGVNAGMSILHADSKMGENDLNDASVVVRLDLGRKRILIPGDAEAAHGKRSPPSVPPAPDSVEGKLLACCAAALRSDVFFAAHHGSMTSNRSAFLDAIGATHFIISSGPKKYSGTQLPDPPVVEELKRRGRLWRTDLDDEACKVNPGKIGPDSDGRPGGCDNVRILIDAAGTMVVDYFRPAD